VYADLSLTKKTADVPALVRRAEAGGLDGVWMGETRNDPALHGWGELQTELARLARDGRWNELGDAVDPAVFRSFASIEHPEKLGALLVDRLGDLVDGVTLGSTHPVEPERLAPVVPMLHSPHAARGRARGREPRAPEKGGREPRAPRS
jgi:hypothetical protein